MSDEMVSRESPKREKVQLVDLELLVRVPGRPEAIRAFTRAEQAQAEQYAGKFRDATVEPLR